MNDRPFETPFEQDEGYDGDRLLVRSPHFTIRSSWEVVTLQGRALAGPVVIGDFYGNPAAAAVDSGERWCVMVGCGLIVYRLGAPWTAYAYDVREPDQWWEHGREPSNVLWLDHVQYVERQRFECRSQESGSRFEVLADDRVIGPIR